MFGKQSISCVLVASMLCLFSGCGSATDNNEIDTDLDETCIPPSGTYTLTFSDDGGDCAQADVNEITSIKKDVELEPGSQCGQYTATNSETLDNGYEVEWTETAQITSSGIENGQATVDVSCPDGYTCTHDFNAYYEKR
jgi:hypothetical protein